MRLKLLISKFETPQPAQLTSRIVVVTYSRPKCCGKLVKRCWMVVGEMHTPCTDIADTHESYLVRTYRKESNLTCLAGHNE